MLALTYDALQPVIDVLEEISGAPLSVEFGMRPQQCYIRSDDISVSLRVENPELLTLGVVDFYLPPTRSRTGNGESVLRVLRDFSENNGLELLTINAITDSQVAFCKRHSFKPHPSNLRLRDQFNGKGLYCFPLTERAQNYLSELELAVSKITAQYSDEIEGE